MTLGRGPHQRRLFTKQLARVHVSFMTDQEFGDLHRAGARSQHQGCLSILIGPVRVGAGIEEHSDKFGIGDPDGLGQRA